MLVVDTNGPTEAVLYCPVHYLNWFRDPAIFHLGFYHLGCFCHALTKMLAYVSAVGCPDIEAPPGGWMLRDGHQLTVGCNVTRQRSHLTCNGTVWVGKIEACHVTGMLQADLNSKKKTLYQETLIQLHLALKPEGPPPEWTLSDALEDAGNSLSFKSYISPLELTLSLQWIIINHFL